MRPHDHPRWQRSSYSTNNANCVEVATLHPGWQRSSYSSNNANCVEVTTGAASTGAPLIGVRDSKDPDGPALAVTPGAWSTFVGRLRRS